VDFHIVSDSYLRNKQILFIIMKEFRVCKSIIAAVVASCMLSSCATIVSGGDPSITIKGDIDEPVNIKTEKQTYTGVVLPAVVKVSRRKINGQHIQITSQNHTFDDIVLKRKINGWAFGNILIGGLIGLAIDCATNCASAPAEKEYMLVPQSKENKENNVSAK
jgi:hypothetical protein